MRAAESEAARVSRKRDGSLDWLREVAQGAALVGVAPSALPPAARMEAERLARAPPQSVRERVGAQDVVAVLAGMLGRLGASPAATSSLLPALAEPLQDAIALCDAADAMLRLEVVHRCTCPRLHVDRLRLRIACSAAGAGTEWLPPGMHPDRAAPVDIRQAPTATFVAMAGANRGPGLWHRSPHACAAHPRLFLSLDLG